MNGEFVKVSHGANTDSVMEADHDTIISKAMSTPVAVANRTLAYRALESGLRPHDTKIDRARSVRAPLN